MIEENLEIRGITRKEIISYLINLGATTYNDSLFVNEKWSCYVEEEEHFHMFQSLIPKVKIKFYSEDKEILKNVIQNFRKKIFRAGG